MLVNSVLLNSALFNFQSLLLVLLLTICTSTYVNAQAPNLFKDKKGLFSSFWKAARVGERLSPYVCLACFIMAFSFLIQIKGAYIFMILQDI